MANFWVSAFSPVRYRVSDSETARDRVALLLDQESPFLELGAFAGFRNKDSTPCANLISGIGNVW